MYRPMLIEIWCVQAIYLLTCLLSDDTLRGNTVKLVLVLEVHSAVVCAIFHFPGAIYSMACSLWILIDGTEGLLDCGRFDVAKHTFGVSGPNIISIVFMFSLINRCHKTPKHRNLVFRFTWDLDRFQWNLASQRDYRPIAASTVPNFTFIWPYLGLSGPKITFTFLQIQKILEFVHLFTLQHNKLFDTSDVWS